jgi:Ca2+-binding RTX toxin-like protein
MLTVQVTQIVSGLGTELFITTNAGDNISVRAATSTSTIVEVLENGTPVVGIPAIDPATLARLTIAGDDGNNVINLSGVTATFFNPNLEIFVDGDDGDDFITGSPDIASTLSGGDGTDVLFGGNQGDLLTGGNGQDLLNGGDGNDTLNGGDGGDILNGQVGDDVVNGGASGDTINGGSGADTLNGQSGNDTITGDTGDDVIDGGSGSDTLDGALGNDSLLGGSEGDSLLGNAGNDTLNGDGGNDSLFGGDDDDLLLGGADDDSLNGENGNDIVNGNSGNDTAFGSSGDDTILGGSGNDLLYGDGDETQANLTGSDRIFGHIGNDTIFGGSGADYIDGGTGDDLVTTNDLVASVNDILINPEGGAGVTTVANFTISLSSEAEDVVLIQYDINSDGTLTGGTATAGVDYVRVLSGTATFQPGETQVLVPVSILGDTLDELAETFFITLTGATNVAILDGLGEGRIIDDDATDLSVSPEVDPQVLVDTLVGTNTGIVVTGFTLTTPGAAGTAVSTGVYSAGGLAPYGLFGDGIVLSTGDVADYGSGPNLTPDQSTAFSFNPDFSQDVLLDPITGGLNDHFDVTRLDISFDLLPGFDTLFFNTVFGSEEFPEFVPLGFFDGFGIYLNGSAPSDNIAFVGGLPVSIAHPDFAAVPGTELDGVLAPGGNPLLTFQAFIGDGVTATPLRSSSLT